MKKLSLFLFAGLLSSNLIAQELPKPSPLATTTQKVGLSEVSLEYSRPGVKERKVFGELVPNDKLWRLGANTCTKFTSSTTVTIDGKELPAGTYAMFATPTEAGTWTIDFNSNTKQGGTADYDAKLNVLSVKAKAMENSFNESLIIEFNNLTSNSGVISIKWEKTRVDIPFTVNTAKIAQKNIDEAIKKGENLDQVYYQAASYTFNTLNEKEKAIKYLDKSLKIKESHGALFLKASILESDGKKDEAIKTAEKALKMANEAGSKGWASHIENSIKKWKEA
ncbi:dihydrolipoamide dehydrogenase [Putridiphycobacter roseus]|uniref:Dihydrolipoamide dehydrogenase n=1 Tax=Putridiphycobacter roseus TaxID=2219161 RepID=A0A2W1N289_9FLAO|nr:DUF2911 domain-containing protein [Putridiphycobacter roseus]PZE18759.1 dihydrolipoamide dehydrogenase [Putridiphycobacter roseus]